MNFLPISILAYALNGGATVIDKILLNNKLPSPLAYVFFINILGLLSIFLFPFGFILNLKALTLAAVSGVMFVIAIYAFFQALKTGEASVVAPVVGSLNPFFTLIIGWIFLNQVLTNNQLLAFFLLLVGASVITLTTLSKVKFTAQLGYMILAGVFFAIHYILAKESYTASNFITGLIGGRLAAALLVTSFLVLPWARKEIFTSNVRQNNFANKTSFLLITGQVMGGLFGLLINYAVSLANPALVNALFGIQSLVILTAAFILHQKYPNLLEERFTIPVISQKIIGVLILSIGLYLLT